MPVHPPRITSLMIILLIQFFLVLQPLLAGEEMAPAAKESRLPEWKRVYEGLNMSINPTAFRKAWEGYHARGFHTGMMAIADFTLPSNAQRFYVIDLKTGTMALHTWVAHGKNSGENYATRFSNEAGSFMSSKGFYKIGDEFISPKHGEALLLEGLDKGVNDRAREREIILHGADYVSPDFIREQGRCGRSHGCPALSRADMETALRLLPPGSMLYVHTGR